MSELNGLPEDRAAAELLRCCGSSAWAGIMAAARPFDSFAALCDYAERVWWSLPGEDWLEAFGAHPKIGERHPATGWSAQEQSGMNSAAAPTAQALAQANGEYLAKFGHIFIVCATGKSAEQMLTILESRMHNEPGDELRIAAAEQSKITRVRLEKLMAS